MSESAREKMLPDAVSVVQYMQHGYCLTTRFNSLAEKMAVNVEHQPSN